MSIWTHVIGTIRIESNNDKKVKKIMGEMHTWYDRRKMKYEYIEDSSCKAIPLGSEGSLEYKFFDFGDIQDPFNPDEKVSETSCGERGLVIKGDLRDYENIDYIAQWFKNKCKRLYTRDAIISIHCLSRIKIIYFDGNSFIESENNLKNY